MDSYQLSPDSPVTRVRVGDKSLREGDDPISLTKDEVTRIEATGAKLEKVKPSSNANS